MLKLVRYLLAIGALYAPVSLVWAADPVCVETGGRKICYSAAADRVTPQTFDLSMRGMCHVATDTGAVTEWTGTAYISSATCPGSAGGTSASSLGKAEDAAHTSGDTGVAILVRRCDTASVGSDTDGDYSVPCVDANGGLWVSLATTISGEDQVNDLLETSGAVVRSTTVATGVTTNTTSALVAVPVGSKTFVGVITGCSSGCTQTQAIYGDQDDDSGTDTDGVLICTITLSADGVDADACPVVTANFPYYYVVTTNTAGTSTSGAVYANY